MNLADVKCPECGHSLEDHFNTLIAGDECRENGCTCDKSREEILLAALNAKQAELDAHQWRPINEAPKDGSTVLGVDKDGTRAIINWADYKEVWDVTHDAEGYVWEDYQPTHYMPLPQPPKEVKE